VGRGILLDYLRYAEQIDQPYEQLENHEISLAQLKSCLAFQGSDLRYGDILIVRSGWTQSYLQLDDAGKREWAARTPPRLGGVATTKEVAEWLWDNGVAAVASDSTAFESLPFRPEGEPGGLGKISLHEVLLGGWGMPIGERGI
jgi:kynurenine formamidase